MVNRVFTRGLTHLSVPYRVSLIPVLADNRFGRKTISIH